MYKDKSRQRLANKENKRKARGMTTGYDKNLTTKASKEKLVLASKGMTEGMTGSEGMTEEFDATKTIYPSDMTQAPRVTGYDIPEFARVLPERTINTILAVLHNRAALGLYDDSVGRWLWAASYYEWEGGLPCK